MHLLIGTGIFLFVVLLIEGGYFAFTTLHKQGKMEAKRRLYALPSVGFEDSNMDITRKRVLSEVPWLNRALLKIRITERASLLLEQSGTRHTLGFFMLLSTLLVFAGLRGGLWVSSNYPVSVLVALFLGILPLLHLLSRKRKRIEKFQGQLPEAMDLVARALRAGHALSGALKMVADEMDDPVGSEIGRTLKEINFGLAAPEALKNLAQRVDCLDLKFFVISVIIQRETGGNLAEILEGIAHIIRERFKLYGRVHILAAEGKISAIILSGLPFLVAFALLLINPGYIGILAKDPVGRVLAAFGLSLMIVGILFIKKMIAIKV